MSSGTVVMHRLVPLSLLLFLVGCKTWEPAATTPQRLIADARPSSVRVTNGDGIQLTLKNPMLVNDSLVSASAPPPGLVFVPPRVGVRADEVALLEVAKFSAVRTVVLVGAIAAASIGWARGQSSAGGTEERPEPLPKDPFFSLIPVFRLLLGSF